MGVTPCPCRLPIGAEGSSQGVIDLVDDEGQLFRRRATAKTSARSDSGRYRRGGRQARRMHMLETLSLYSDELMEALLEERTGHGRRNSSDHS